MNGLPKITHHSILAENLYFIYLQSHKVTVIVKTLNNTFKIKIPPHLANNHWAAKKNQNQFLNEAFFTVEPLEAFWASTCTFIIVVVRLGDFS